MREQGHFAVCALSPLEHDAIWVKRPAGPEVKVSPVHCPPDGPHPFAGADHLPVTPC